MNADLEEILTVVNILLEDVAEKPDRMQRAQEIARRDIATTGTMRDLERLRAIEEAAKEWKGAGDNMALFRTNPSFDHTLTTEDRNQMMLRFHEAVTKLHAALK